jgi:hypothetical protein
MNTYTGVFPNLYVKIIKQEINSVKYEKLTYMNEEIL